MPTHDAPVDWIWPEEAAKDTPSIRRGMSQKDETRLRSEGIKIIVEVGTQMKLQFNTTLAAAGIFLHRFYMLHPLQDFPREITALGCLYLAGKVEETPKKCKDLCRAAAEKYPQTFGDPRPLIERVMGMERLLLTSLKFDLHIDLPYKFLKSYIKQHELSKENETQIGQTAWTFVNDSFHTMLCVLWEPEVIAIAMLHLAFQMKKEDTSLQPKSEWWAVFVGNLTQKTLDAICHQVLDFYAETQQKPFEIK